jgi:hypothetical protein
MRSLIAVLLIAAGAHAAPECSLGGGASWREYRSQHFIIDAAGYDGDPGKLVAVFEDLYAAVLASLTSDPVEIPAQVRAVVLPHERDLADYTGNRYITGVFWVSQRGEPVILLSADHLDDVPDTVAHELTHYISSYLFPRQPYWFAEGLAQFVESVAKQDKEKRRWAGGDPEKGLNGGVTELSDMPLLLRGAGGGYVTNSFLSAFALFRFLWNERPKQLSEYERQLMEGAAPDDAWKAAFPEWVGIKANSLTGEVMRHWQNGKGLRWEIKPGKVDHTFTKKSASPGDLHLALLDIQLMSANKLMFDRIRRKSLEEAIAEEPAHPVVAAELARLQKAPLLPVLRAATARSPEDGRGWYQLGIESTEPAERETALRKAVAYWPDGALAQAALANQLAGTSRAREALPLANRALDLAPWHPTAVSALATVALELGQCKQALVLQTRALEIVESERVGSVGMDKASFKGRLAELRKRCP